MQHRRHPTPQIHHHHTPAAMQHRRHPTPQIHHHHTPAARKQPLPPQPASPPADATNTFISTTSTNTNRRCPPLSTPLATTSTVIPPQPPLTPATIAGATATEVAFPVAAAAVAGCGWQFGHHRRGGAYTTSDLVFTFPCMVVTSILLRNI
uniref:Uncharacterized protein n=1 Tax=Tanacetum cinerariifolium TaxID=118510 RepID=A0A6L2KQ20_TANCI|nr:hypothetical protein [Tanacetum cinerariifolium]